MSWYNQRGALDKNFKTNTGASLIPNGESGIVVEEEEQIDGNSEYEQEENVDINISDKNVTSPNSIIIWTGAQTQTASVDDHLFLLFFHKKDYQFHFVR